MSSLLSNSASAPKGLRFLRAAALACLAALAGCVTINIYFPAAAAQKAADKIIEDVWQLKKPQGKEGQAPAPAKPEVPQK